MGRVRFEATYSRLANLFGLPEGSRIYGVRGAPDSFGATCCEFFVEHPDLPNVQEGIVPPLAMPIVCVEAGGDVHFVKWGLPE